MKKLAALYAVLLISAGFTQSVLASTTWQVSSTSNVHCSSPHGLWTNQLNGSNCGSGGNYYDFASTSTLTENDDGTAVLSATASNPLGSLATIDIIFSGLLADVSDNQKKRPAEDDGSWYFYSVIDSGSIDIDGTVYNIPSIAGGYMLQIGAGANDKTDAFGASTWLNVDGYNAHWDLNMDLTAVPVPAAAWLFGSGLIALVSVARRNA